MVIPENERYAGLKATLFSLVDRLASLRSAHPEIAAQQPMLFVFLMFPSLVAVEVLTEDQRLHQDQRKAEITQLGFDVERAKQELEEIREGDAHIRECCPSSLQLAAYLDSHFFAAALDVKSHDAPQQRLEFVFDEFERTTYHQGRFRRIALSHLFNFDMGGNSATFKGNQPFGDIRVERLNNEAIPSILGESGFQTFLHSPGIGNCFVFEEEGASPVDDFQWLSDKRQKALYFGRVLQYSRDGVVHLGYSASVFLPDWASQVRRSGLFFIGELRRTPYAGGSKPYVLDAAAAEQIDLWWRAATAPAIIEALNNPKGKLRQAIWRAGDYYESSQRKSDPVDRLISLAIGFESLFSPDDQAELNFRICQTAAQFLGENTMERLKIFSELREMYKRRSKIVHGSYDLEKYLKGEFVTAEELDGWASLLRRALVGFLALYFKGPREQKRETVLDRITELNFDDSKRAALRVDCDLEALFRQ